MLKHGEHIDVVVSELALGYENYLHEKAENDSKGIPTLGKKYTNTDLQNMVNTVRAQNDSQDNKEHNDTIITKDGERT